MGTANLTAIKDRIAELTVVPKPKDRTGAARSRRYRQRRKSQEANVTITPSVTPETIMPSVTPETIIVSQSARRHGVVPFVLLVAALAVAGVSGAFSIAGLTSIFVGAFWPVVGMGVALETAKLSAVAWLGRRYGAPRWLKCGIVTLVVALMALNVVGAYGYLARAHIAHEVAGEAVVASHQAQIDARNQVASANLADIDKRIGQVDAAIAEATKRGRTASAMALAEHQAGRRGQLLGERERAASALASVEVERAGVESERAVQAADFGPVLYLSRLMGVETDAALRWFIVVVACLLDPAALMLLLAASVSRMH
jgi:hypothetical protein